MSSIMGLPANDLLKPAGYNAPITADPCCAARCKAFLDGSYSRGCKDERQKVVAEMLGIIDGCVDRRKEKIGGYEEREAYYLLAEERAKMNAVLTIRAAIEGLKGEEQE